MADRIEELAQAFTRFPGIGPRQAKRFVFHLLSSQSGDRKKLSDLIGAIGSEVRQCPECMRFAHMKEEVCNYCSDATRDDSMLLIVEKDQDLASIERSQSYRGRYFVLGGVLMLSGKGVIRERELVDRVKKRIAKGLKEIVIALSATSEGEHTMDRVRELLVPFRDSIRLSVLGRGLATGSELEYVDAKTITGAFQNRKET